MTSFVATKIVYALATTGNTPTFFPTNTSSIRYFINHSNKTATSALMAINPLVAVLLLWLMKYLIDEVFVGKNVGVLPVVASAYTILVATKLVIDYLLT